MLFFTRRLRFSFWILNWKWGNACDWLFRFSTIIQDWWSWIVISSFSDWCVFSRVFTTTCSMRQWAGAKSSSPNLSGWKGSIPQDLNPETPFSKVALFKYAWVNIEGTSYGVIFLMEMWFHEWVTPHVKWIFQRGVEGHIQGLQLVRSVGRNGNNMNVILEAKFITLQRNMAAVVVHQK